MGTAITKIGSAVFRRAAKTPNIGRIVYSTGGNKGTLFDALIDSYSKPHMAKKLAQQVNKVAVRTKKEVDTLLRPICEKAGEFGIRVKTVPKITGKMSRALKEVTVDDAVKMISQGRFHNVIGDGLGTRVIVDDLSKIDGLVDDLVKLHKKGKINISLVENYHGKGITPYLADSQIARLQTLDRGGKGITIVDKIKSAGYTRTNMDIYVNGNKIEFQLGGKYTTPLGEVDHFRYDMFQNLRPDVSKLTDNQRKLFAQMQRATLPIMNNKPVVAKYEQYMTNDMWKVLKNAEEARLPFPTHFASPPRGVPSLLSAENLFKLSHA